LTTAEKGEEALEKACETIIEKLNELLQKLTNKTFVNVTTTPSGVINLDEEEDEEIETKITPNKLTSKIPTKPIIVENVTKRKRRADVEIIEQASPKRLRQNDMSFTTLLGQPAEFFYSSFNILNHDRELPSRAMSTPPQYNLPQQTTTPPQQAIPINTLPAAIQQPSTQPFSPKVIILPQGAVLHEDKQTGTRVLVLSSQEQYDRLHNQLLGNS
jgi:hypothetical protein